MFFKFLLILLFFAAIIFIGVCACWLPKIKHDEYWPEDMTMEERVKDVWQEIGKIMTGVMAYVIIVAVVCALAK